MSDWQSDIDRRLQAREEAKAKRKAAEKARQRKQQAEQRAREAERHLQQHKRRYKCHICGKPSDGPSHILKIRNPVSGDYEEVDYPFGLHQQIEYDDWYKPAGLQRCSICCRWACFEREHIYRGICEKCAKKGYLPGDRRKWWHLLMLV
jgi:hypothetical protein